MAAASGDSAGLSRRWLMASGALAAIAVLAGDRTRAAASPVRRGRAAGAPPRLRMDTTPDLTTVLAPSPLPPFAPVSAQPGDVTVSPQQVFQPFLGVGAALPCGHEQRIRRAAPDRVAVEDDRVAGHQHGRDGRRLCGRGVSNWARSVILWNLALDQNGEPNQDKPDRRGVVTVNNQTGAVTRNPEYYALAHLAMFAQPGALRCESPSYGPA
jgi:hypothetical protein